MPTAKLNPRQRTPYSSIPEGRRPSLFETLLLHRYRRGTLPSSISQTLKKSNDLVSRHRLAIQISLDLIAAFEIQASPLLLRLHSLRRSRYAETQSETRDSADDCKTSFVREQISDERLIDFELVELKLRR